MSKSKINVIVVDDHDLIREGLNRIISFEDDLVIIGQYSNGEELIKNIKNGCSIIRYKYAIKKWIRYFKGFKKTI